MSSPVGQARFTGCISFTAWPRRDVEALLPAGLELAAPSGNDRYPVVFVFGEQTEGAFLFGGFTVPMGVRYGELGIAVPDVRHPAAPGVHNFVPRMYASYFPAVWNGNAHYGYGKELARLGWQGPVYVLAREDGRLLLHAESEPTGDWVAAARADPPGFAAVRELVSRPMLGRRADGTWVRSTWEWDFGGAAVRTCDTCVTTDAPLAPGVAPARYADVAPGSFEVRDMLWRVSWPSAAATAGRDDHRRRRSSPNARIKL